MLEALSAIIILSDEIEQPCWIDGRPNGTIVAMANGLLDIETQDFYDHTPKYFNQTAVPFNYNPRAPEPKRWLTFLGLLWPNEPQAVAALGEWFG